MYKKIRGIIIIALGLTLSSFTGWQNSFEKARQIAKEKHQLILLNFSGSDWCGPCIRMKKEIFGSQVFSVMADTSLVMYNADFPRNKKNQLDKTVQKQNESLADKYNPEGKFPLTLLLNADGKIIKTWDGLPNENAEQFSKLVKHICDANK
jgi:thioredoxin-related protein